MAKSRPAGRIVVAMGCMLGAAAALTASPAADAAQVSVREVAPPYPSARPVLNERRTARPGEAVYAERATGLPAARLAETLALNVPGGRKVTVKPDDDLPKYLLNREPHYCAFYRLVDGKAYRDAADSVLSAGREGEKKEAGFHVCLQDTDGDGRTFEAVLVITLELEIVQTKVVKQKEFHREVESLVRRTHYAAGGSRLSPRRFTATTVNPGSDDYFEAVIRLTNVGGGAVELRSELLDRNGRREFISDAVTVAASGRFPVLVTVPHPFEGERVYGHPAAAGEEDRRQMRAAQLEILGVAGDAVTYRVVRGFMPWRYWHEGPARKKQKRMRWRPRPGGQLSARPPASIANEVR